MHIQYFLIDVYDMGYIIAIGRHLFPMFLLFLAFHFSMIPWLQRNYWVKRLTFVMPIFTLIIYYPPIFSYLTNNNESLQQIIAVGTIIWILLYTIISIALLLFEAYSIEMIFFPKEVYFNYILHPIINFILFSLFRSGSSSGLSILYVQNRYLLYEHSIVSTYLYFYCVY